MEGHQKFVGGGGGGVLKGKILETKYKAKVEFLGRWGGGAGNKNLSWGELYGYFLELHNKCLLDVQVV